MIDEDKLVLLDIKPRNSLADELCEWDEFDLVKSELFILGHRLAILTSSLDLDTDGVRDTSLSFTFRLANARAILKTALKEKYPKNLVLLRDLKAACH